MTDNKLCFVLGAGASAHFGYPLGNELVEAMETFIRIIRQTKGSYTNTEFEEARKFIKNIKSYNPLNIDYYLYNHPNQQDIGKKLIEAVILRSQHHNVFKESGDLAKWWRNEGISGNRTGAFIKKNSNHDDDTVFFPAGNWVKFIHHRIVANCKDAESSEQLLEQIKDEMNRIYIVTFNYDLSFEQALWGYFKPSKFNDGGGELKKYLFTDFFVNNIEHVYGKVALKDTDGNSIENYECEEFDFECRKLTGVFQSATGKDINIIGIDKSTEVNKKAIKFLAGAQNVYFLGYAFDEFNNNKIGLNDVLKEDLDQQRKKTIFYTNYGDGLIVDVNIRNFFDGYASRPSKENSKITQIGEKMSGILAGTEPLFSEMAQIVKSTKNVYDALERDFKIPFSKKG